MEKTRRLKTFSIVALIVAVIGLSIAFAALSKTLTINGTGSVDAANWDIHFKNISEPALTGKATTTGAPTLSDNGATINDMKVSLKEPGDKVVYTVDIENAGDINAEIDSITLPTFTTAQSNILDFKAVYTSNNKDISEGDILESKETKNVTITIMYKDITDESLLPKEGISVNLKYELHFIQTDKASGSSSQGGNKPSSSYGVAIASKQITDTITVTYYGGEEQQDGTYKGGTLVMSGTGDMENYDEESAPFLLFLIGASSMQDVQNNLQKYMDENENILWKYYPSCLVIDEGITGFSDGLFSNGYKGFPDSLTSILLPSTLIEIPSQAFGYQTHLTELIIKPGVKSIGTQAFYNCTNLSTIAIPKTVNYISNLIFEKDINLSTIYVQSQEFAELLSGEYDSDLTTVIVDPSKFN